MKISYGNAGWVQIVDKDLPGELFLKLEEDGRGRWRTRDFYLQGDWRHVVGADLRELDLTALEEIVQNRMNSLTSRARIAGPDTRTLIGNFATTYATAAYAGRHCEACDAPLRGLNPREPERWSNDWVALSWFAQHQDSRIKRPKRRSPSAKDVVSPSKVPRLQRPTAGLTDEFLQHVSDAYREALIKELNPAPELARQVGDNTSPRTIHKWVSVARQRGIMPPARMKGRPNP
jgi:hypothetical protein